MANYQESNISGVSWKRCYRIDVRNQYQDNKSLIFLEEVLTLLNDGRVLTEPSTNIQIQFLDPNKVINLINPETGDSLNTTVTYQDLYTILHSLYIQSATERDIAENLGVIQ